MKKSEVLGWALTVIYFVGVAILVYVKRSSLPSLELNEVGDFLAGVFGPIAFLWLVLGYIQQGRELKLSSEALRMQAEELKASVEQQTIMAMVATDQHKAQKEANELQAWRHEQEISPKFEVTAHRNLGPTGERIVQSCVRIMNRGHDARYVSFKFDHAIGIESSLEFGDLKNGLFSEDISFEYKAPDEILMGRCFIEYLRVDHKKLKEEFSYMVTREGVITISRSVPDVL